jgi:hypothetical protein
VVYEKNPILEIIAMVTLAKIPADAPLPQDFAFFGLELFQTRNKIKPINGNMKLKNAKPKLEASFEGFVPCFSNSFVIRTPFNCIFDRFFIFVKSLYNKFIKIVATISPNVPAVYAVLPARIRALHSKDQGWQNVGGGWRGNERSD